MPIRPSGNLIIADQTFHVDAPIVNFREPPFWDATAKVCIPTATDPAPVVQAGRTAVPYGNLPDRRTRSATRLRPRCCAATARTRRSTR